MIHPTPAAEVESRPFPLLGISYTGIQHFIKRIGGRSRIGDYTTTQICEKFVVPMTKEFHMSFCDFHVKEGNENNAVGKATIFISHTWKSNFLDLIDAIENFPYNSDGLSNENNPFYFWIDLFSNNQNDLSDPPPFEWWCQTFKGAISAIHRVIMVISPWENPIPLRRAWCLWEVFCAIDTQSEFSVALCSRERMRFEEMILDHSELFYDMLGNIDLRYSEATNPVDKERIFEVVEKTVGLWKLNTLVTTKMKEWVVGKVRELAARRLMFSLGTSEQTTKPASVSKLKLGEDSPELKKLNYHLVYASVLTLNGELALAQSEFSAISRKYLEYEWDGQIVFQHQLKVLQAEMIYFNHEGLQVYKHIPISLRLWTKFVKTFSTEDYNQAIALLNEGISFFENRIKEIVDDRENPSQLVSSSQSSLYTKEGMLLVYWYLRALRVRCDLLLQGEDITLEIVEHFIQKTKIYRQADNGNDMNNFEVAQALSRLGNYQYLFHNEPLQALTTYQESYDRHALILSSTHPSTLRIQFTLACLFYDFGNYQKAFQLFKDCYSKSLEKFEERSLFVTNLKTRYLMACVLTCHVQQYFAVMKWREEDIPQYSRFKYISSKLYEIFLARKPTKIQSFLHKFSLVFPFVFVYFCYFAVWMCLLLVTLLFLSIISGFLGIFVVLPKMLLHRLLTMCLSPNALYHVFANQRHSKSNLWLCWYSSMYFNTVTLVVTMLLTVVMAILIVPISLAFLFFDGILNWKIQRNIPKGTTVRVFYA